MKEHARGLVRVLVGPLGVVAFAVLVGLMAGGWQWANRGILVEVVTDPGDRNVWDVMGPAPTPFVGQFGTYPKPCPEGQAAGVKDGYLTYIGQVPAHLVERRLQCLKRGEPIPKVVETQFQGPFLDDLLLTAVVGAGVYFLAVAFILSYRALRRSSVAAGPSVPPSVGAISDSGQRRSFDQSAASTNIDWEPNAPVDSEEQSSRPKAELVVTPPRGGLLGRIPNNPVSRWLLGIGVTIGIAAVVLFFQGNEVKDYLRGQGLDVASAEVATSIHQINITVDSTDGGYAKRVCDALRGVYATDDGKEMYPVVFYDPPGHSYSGTAAQPCHSS